MVDKACKVVVCGGGDGTVTSRLSQLAAMPGLASQGFGLCPNRDLFGKSEEFCTLGFSWSRAVSLESPAASQAC